MVLSNSNIRDKRQITKDTYKLCPQCGNFNIYSVKEKFCNVCGTKLISECPDCCEPIIYPISKYCPVCGRRLVKAD